MKKRLFVCLLIIISLLITKNVNAETYEGEYSIDYLLRNYNLVTLGGKELNVPNNYSNLVGTSGKAINSTNVDGAVLINGDYILENEAINGDFGTKAGNVKSYIKGNIIGNITTPSQVATDPNYLDFNKMYEAILTQSNALADKTEYYINNQKLEISKPGIYTINNTATETSCPNTNYYNCVNKIIIKNYDSNSLYVFNYYNEYIDYVPYVLIMEKGSSNAISLKDYIDNGGTYTGNIIWNFPNLKALNIYITTSNGRNQGFGGHIIAPNAYIFLEENAQDYVITNNNNNYYYRENYYGTIIAKSIRSYKYEISYIRKANYSLSNKILDEENYYYERAKDYSDDLYTRNYSISDLLQNYSLITLGHKPIDSKSKILEYGSEPGSIKLFHITGQALIAGDLYGKTYSDIDDEYLQNIPKFDRTNFDLECNKACESYIRGNTKEYISSRYGYDYVVSRAVIQPWDNMLYDNVNYLNKVNMLLSSNTRTYGEYELIDDIRYYNRVGSGNISAFNVNNFVNFDRLYNNIVAEQKGIEEGTKLSVESDGILHIPTGGTYTIEDISEVKEIVFDNFEKNKDELTVITIKNDGDINFPLISKNENMDKAILTNDYFGKEKATHRYELETFLSEDSYYGNIVWNLPNAGYIKLKENAPFAGHMIAPNADVETPELHFAGCFIVNSIYGEGNTEAHFYPINSNLKCVSREYDSLSKTQKMRFNDYRLRKSLGGDNSTIEKEIIGDKAQYDKDIALFESLIDKCDNREIIVNPKTSVTIATILGLIAIGFISTIAIKKNKKIKE